MSPRFSTAYGGLWRFVAVFLIGMAVAALLGLLALKYVLPDLAPLLTFHGILKGFGLAWDLGSTLAGAYICTRWLLA